MEQTTGTGMSGGSCIRRWCTKTKGQTSPLAEGDSRHIKNKVRYFVPRGERETALAMVIKWLLRLWAEKEPLLVLRKVFLLLKGGHRAGGSSWFQEWGTTFFAFALPPATS